MFFDVLDKNLKIYYITAHKVMFAVYFTLSSIFSFLYVFWKELIIFASITFIVSFVFLLSFLCNRKKYGKKVMINDTNLQVYNYNGKIIKTINLINGKSCELTVSFGYSKSIIYKKCLVLYTRTEVYDEMEYRSFGNNQDVLIIQNPLLIDEIKKIIKC